MIAGLLVIGALTLALACLRTCLDEFRWRDRAVGALALVALAWLIVCGLLPIGDPRALLVLHEGGTACTLQSLFGEDKHVGPLWHDGLRALARGGPPLAWIGRVNIASAGLALLGMIVAAAVVTRHVAGVALTIVFVVNSRGFLMGTLSETPAPTLWFATLAALPAWRLLVDGARREPRVHRLALSSLLTCTALATGLRSELVLVGGALVGAALVASTAGPGALDRAYETTQRGLRRVLALSWFGRAAVLLALLMIPPRVARYGFHARLVVVAALPSPDLLRLPLAVTSAVPLPVAALAVLGIATALRRGPIHALTALTTAQLLAVYLSASHNVGWEMLRYTTLAVALVWLHALAGWAALEAYATRAGWAPAWRGSFLLLLLASLVEHTTSNPAHPGWWNASARAQHLVVRQSKQREAEALARDVLEAPRCVFVARVRRDGSRHAPMVLATFGRAWRVRFEASPETSLAALHLRGLPCVKYFRTLDCDGQGGARCDDDLREATPERVTTERWGTYCDPEEYGTLAPIVRYGTWRLR